METSLIHWKFLDVHHRFPCFMRGCHNEARHLAKIRKGLAVVQVCLCESCHTKPAKTIWGSLVRGAEDGTRGQSQAVH